MVISCNAYSGSCSHPAYIFSNIYANIDANIDFASNACSNPHANRHSASTYDTIY
jgi:hypothetical protein